MTPPRKTYRDIDGWFPEIDHEMFRAVLGAQADSEPGDLVEIGVYRGKSAVVIGDYVRAGERFVAIDTFGDLALLGVADGMGEREDGRNYFDNLTRAQFESNYLSVHDELPHVVQALSSDIVDHVPDGAARFVHVDGSHQYADVAVDARNARRLLRPDGVVAFDDYRKPNAPGVAAAVWEAVFEHGLIPVALTRQKFYGTFGDPVPLEDAVRSMLAEQARWEMHEQDMLGRTVLQIAPPRRKRRSAGEAKAVPAPPSSLVRRLAAKLRG